jgi:phage terminase Nu1 subunit (DNA packaging protein)
VRYFDPRAALELVCQAEAVNPAREKARLDRLRADKVELDLSAQRETLVHVDEVSQEWRKISAEMQAHLLAFPVRAAPLIVGCKRMPVAKSILEKEVYACLESLHSGDNRYIAAD